MYRDWAAGGLGCAVWAASARHIHVRGVCRKLEAPREAAVHRHVDRDPDALRDYARAASAGVIGNRRLDPRVAKWKPTNSSAMIGKTSQLAAMPSFPPVSHAGP